MPFHVLPTVISSESRGHLHPPFLVRMALERKKAGNLSILWDFDHELHLCSADLFQIFRCDVHVLTFHPIL